MPNVINELIKVPEVKTKLSNVVGLPKIAPSILSVYLGFKKPPKELGNKYYSTIFFDEGISNQKQMAEYHHNDFSKRTCIFVANGQYIRLFNWRGF